MDGRTDGLFSSSRERQASERPGALTLDRLGSFPQQQQQTVRQADRQTDERRIDEIEANIVFTFSNGNWRVRVARSFLA